MNQWLLRDKWVVGGGGGAHFYPKESNLCLRHKVCRLQKGMVNNMTKKQKKMLYRIIVTFLLFAVLMVCEHTGGMDGWNKIVLFVIYLVPYLVIGYDIVYKAARNISHGQVFDGISL